MDGIDGKNQWISVIENLKGTIGFVPLRFKRIPVLTCNSSLDFNLGNV